MDICDNSLDANKDVGNLHSNTLNNNQDINPTTVKLKDGASSKNTHTTTDFTGMKPGEYTYRHRRLVLELLGNKAIPVGKGSMKLEYGIDLSYDTLRRWTKARYVIFAASNYKVDKLDVGNNCKIPSALKNKINEIAKEDEKKSSSSSSNNIGINDSSSDIGSSGGINDSSNAANTTDTSSGSNSLSDQSKSILEQRVAELEEKLKYQEDRNSTLEERLLNSIVSNINNSEFSQNRDLMYRVIKKLLPYIERPHSGYILSDLHYGEGKFHSVKLDKLFKRILKFDKIKNGLNPIYKRDGILSYDSLKAMIGQIRAHIALIDPPYVVYCGGHHAFNCTMNDTATKQQIEKQKRYGIEICYTLHHLLLFQLEGLANAERLLKVGGFALSKSDHASSKLVALSNEALPGSTLKIIGQVQFISSGTKLDNVSKSHVSLSKHKSSTLTILQKVAGPTPSLNTKPKTLPQHVAAVRIKANADSIDMCIKQRKENDVMRDSFKRLYNHAVDIKLFNCDKKGIGECFVRSLHFASDYFSFSSTGDVVWRPYDFDLSDVFAIKSSQTSDKLMDQYKKEYARRIATTNMCAVAFSALLVHKNITETDSTYDRVGVLRQCGIFSIPIQKLFCRGSIIRLKHNVCEITGANKSTTKRCADTANTSRKKKKQKK